MQNNSASPVDTEGFTSEQVLLVTKFAIPPVRSDLVARPRLVNQLQQGLQRPLTLIAAPAGFGETTLLSTWLEHAPFSVAWVSLESGDDDLTRFWSYVFTALSRVHPGQW
jgi:LuxR family transcriptional regulator, maltose regulon positive regulatory protein